MPRALALIPDGLRDKADAGELVAQRQLCELLALGLRNASDVLAALDELERYACLAAARGEYQDLHTLVWVHGFRAGWHEGEDEEVYALADAVVVIDEMADAGFEDATAALFAVANLHPRSVAEDALALAVGVRSVGGAAIIDHKPRSNR